MTPLPPPQSQPRLTRASLLILATTGALGSMAIHMFVPAMPLVARALDAPDETIQLAVTLFLIGMGLGQLIAGPISDRAGRKPVLLGGLGLYTLGAIGCASAVSAAVFLLARLVQALGAAAGIVAVRALVVDLSDRHDAAAKLATVMAVQLLSPALSPMVGGTLATFGGWRVIFALLTAAGLAGGIVCFRRIAVPGRSQGASERATVARSYLRLLRNIRFLRFAAGIACSSTALYVFLSVSAFLFVDREGLNPGQAGLCYFTVAAAGICGTLLVRRLEVRGGALRFGLTAIGVGGALLAGFTLAGLDGPVAVVASMAPVAFGGGIAAPTGIAGAMHAEEGLTGTAASLAGAIQLIASGGTASLIVHSHLDSPLAMATTIFTVGLVGVLIAPRGRAT